MNGSIDDMILTAVAAVVIALVILLVIFSGRMNRKIRSAVEFTTGLIFYPSVTVLWAWKAYEGVAEGDWLIAVAMFVIAIIFAVTGVFALRRRTLAPFAKRAA